MSMIHLTINGKQIQCEAGTSILKAAADSGIQIPNLCFNETVPVYGACGLCLVEAENSPRLMRACASAAAEGMVINTETERVIRARKTALELLMADHNGDCVSPCSLNCPAGTDCQAYIKQTALGNYREAVKIIKKKIPIPASIGRVCPHPCEKACSRQYVEAPVSIANLKFFAADQDMNGTEMYRPEKAPATGKTVAVIGGGPAGLSAAYYLALQGHSVTIYEAMPDMGGMLRYGIPEYRLPKHILEKEVRWIESLGVEMKTGVRTGTDVSLDDIRRSHDAVLTATGAWISQKIGCPGEDTEGVTGGIDFLRKAVMAPESLKGKRISVVGGGNTAMDACRTALRLGAEEVTVIYRRTREEMPAEDIEIREAVEEGVIFRFLTSPAEILSENGKVSGIKLQAMEQGEADASGRRTPVPVPGKFDFLRADMVIAATGQKSDTSGFEILKLNRKGCIIADELTFATSEPGIFAAGDVANKGASIAIEAIAEGYRAALAINAFLAGTELPSGKDYVSERTPSDSDFKVPVKQRVSMPKLEPEERKNSFREVNTGFSEIQAKQEASRCLECGCSEYGRCRLIKTANLYHADPERIKGIKRNFGKEKKLVSIERDNDKCILCGLCVRTCLYDAEKGFLEIMGRGSDSVIKPEFLNPDETEFCSTCLKCAEICPTGAMRILTEKP